MAFNEVTVMRRVFRDGGSEYFINKTPCRLKDIQQLFMGTGVGRTSYSIMAQGNITQLLSSKPEDRRMVFEEAAGITKFKAQKKEALRKLEYTEQNLLRVSDLIREVKRQIGSLLYERTGLSKDKAAVVRRAHRQEAPADVADLLRARGRFDVVILDPPAFIQRKKDLKKGIAAYRRINELGLQLLRPGGLLISASCSMHLSRAELIAAMQQAAVRTACQIRVVEQGAQGPDHPIHPAIPETEYLKAVFALKL